MLKNITIGQHFPGNSIIHKLDPEEKKVWKYDDEGNRIEWLCYDSDNKLKEKKVYKYDEKRNLLEETHTDKDHNIIFSEIYDKQGNRIKKIDDGEVIEEYIIEYY